ncbi:MAG: L-threonylcarbamoyladenylate synthase [Robiginitomaculum sp.]
MKIASLMQVLAGGGVAIAPTETVYGLCARADKPAAISRLYVLKGRGGDKPLALCVAGLPMARLYGTFSPLAGQLAEAFWPGPLTLVVPAVNPRALDKRLYNGATIALRCPDIDWAKSLTAPLALTSANRAGAPDSLTATAAKAALGAVDAILEDDEAINPRAKPSTIIAIQGGNRARILRAGALGAKNFAAFNIDWSADA